MKENGLLTGKRIVDVSCILHPGKEKRRLEIRDKTFPFDGSMYFDVDMMSHLGTHVEVPLHWFRKTGKDLVQMPVETFIGEAVLLNLVGEGPGTPITHDVLERAAKGRHVEGRILILRSPGSTAPSADGPDTRPYITPDTARWLIEKKAKMFGLDDTVTPEKSPEIAKEIHDLLMARDIPFLEVLTNLGQLKRDEFFLIALPLRVAGLDSSPVRAIAIEDV